MMVGMAVATMLMTLFRQHLAFLQIYSAQSFLTEEAPIISSYVSRMVGKADRFRLYTSLAALRNGNAPVAAGIPAPVVALQFRQPDRAGQANEMRTAILSSEPLVPAVAGRERLMYYLVPDTGVIGAPQWAVTRNAGNLSPRDTRFVVEDGILKMRLTGPNGEVVTYSGSMQQ